MATIEAIAFQDDECLICFAQKEIDCNGNLLETKINRARIVSAPGVENAKPGDSCWWQGQKFYWSNIPFKIIGCVHSIDDAV